MSNKSLLKNTSYIILFIILAVCAILMFYFFQYFIKFSETLPAKNSPSQKPSVDLKNCINYFDGCNNCLVDNGQIIGCTKKFCSKETMKQPECLKYKNDQKITNFKECVDYGNPVMESYPRKCKHGEQIFIEDLGNMLEKEDLIRLDVIRPNTKIESPLLITGEARGKWFFEASFPVILTDWDGLIIAEGIAQAEGEWMTEDFVRFKAKLEFEKPTYKNNGALILKKDNPSGLPEFDDALEIPVIFK